MRWFQLWLVLIYVSQVLSGSTRPASESWMDSQQAKFSQQTVISTTIQSLAIDAQTPSKPKEKVSGSADQQDCLSHSLFEVMACQHTLTRVPTDNQIFSVGYHRSHRPRAPPVFV